MLSEADLAHLRHAVQLSQRARERGNHPFVALLVGANGEVLAEAENTVLQGDDPTAHAEMNLVRLVAGRYDAETLARCTLFSSAEPCAMCAAAIHWSGIGRLVYALSLERLYRLRAAEAAARTLRLPCREVLASCAHPIEVVGPELEAEAEQVHLGYWQADS